MTHIYRSIVTHRHFLPLLFAFMSFVGCDDCDHAPMQVETPDMVMASDSDMALSKAGPTLKVAFAPGSPMSQTYTRDQRNMDVIHLDFEAIGGDVTCGGIVLHHSGAALLSDIADIKAYDVFDGSEINLNKAEIGSDTVLVRFANKIFISSSNLPGRIRFSITQLKQEPLVSAQHVFSLESAQDVLVDPAVKVEGTFPIQSNPLTIDRHVTTALRVKLHSPVPQIQRGTHDAVLLPFDIQSLYFTNFRVSDLGFRIMKQYGNSNGLVKGSKGSEYFSNIKIKNLDTGATIMGPIALPLGLADNSPNSGTMSLTDSWYLQPYQVLHLAVTADIASDEDGPNELLNQPYEVAWFHLGEITDSAFVDMHEEPLEPQFIEYDPDVDFGLGRFFTIVP